MIKKGIWNVHFVLSMVLFMYYIIILLWYYNVIYTSRILYTVRLIAR